MPSPLSPCPPGAEWLSLAELGQLYGISPSHAGKLLRVQGLREPGGEPTALALSSGLARHRHPVRPHQPLWHRQRCGERLERSGQQPRGRRQLVGLWADLLTALQQASASVSTSVEEMAAEIPRDLVRSVNLELRQRGCSLQVGGALRKAAAPRPACSPAPAAAAADARRYG
jgi:hypothetical protein